MADELISDIARTVTLPDADAVMEGQGIALGSFQMLMTALNYPLKRGIYTIPSATATTFTVPYGSTLRSNPTAIRLQIMLAADTDDMPQIAPVLPGTTTNFELVLSGPTGNLTTKVLWEAYA